jgi:hypothetical protein
LTRKLWIWAYPRVERDLLMLAASFKRSPSAPESFCLFAMNTPHKITVSDHLQHQSFSICFQWAYPISLQSDTWSNIPNKITIQYTISNRDLVQKDNTRRHYHFALAENEMRHKTIGQRKLTFQTQQGRQDSTGQIECLSLIHIPTASLHK